MTMLDLEEFLNEVGKRLVAFGIARDRNHSRVVRLSGQAPSVCRIEAARCLDLNIAAIVNRCEESGIPDSSRPQLLRDERE